MPVEGGLIFIVFWNGLHVSYRLNLVGLEATPLLVALQY